MTDRDADALPIEITFPSSMGDEPARALRLLLADLLPLAAVPDVRFLKRIIVVPDGTMETAVNDLISQGSTEDTNYVAGQNPAGAVLVPVETNEALNCFLLLTESHLEGVTPRAYHPIPLVSSLLEELLHLRDYVRIWQQLGTLYRYGEPGPRRDLSVLCGNVHSEYVACRRKAEIATTTPLFDSDSGLTIHNFYYGHDLKEHLDTAGTWLADMLSDAAAGTLDHDEAWGRIWDVTYRRVFEPLAREAAFRAGSPPLYNRLNNSPGRSRFYRRHVDAYWPRVRSHLERSYDRDLADLDVTFSGLFDVIAQFLHSIGLTYAWSDGSSSRFGFNPRPLRRERTP